MSRIRSFQPFILVLVRPLPEFSTATAHNLILTDQLGAEFTAIQGEVNVKVNPVEDTLWGVHTLEVGLQVLARQIRGESNNFLDAYD
jgi:hypothetical protein